MKKKVWSKPECNKVKLVPAEAKIVGCKVSSHDCLPGMPHASVASS
jgi:hypothetical protein